MLDKAWSLVRMAASGSGVRGKVFRMHPGTANAILRERRTPGLSLAMLYSVPVVLDSTMRPGEIALVPRRQW